MGVTAPFRLIDSGVADGRRQIARDAALTELHAAGLVPDTVRFLRFPPTVLVGRHQAIGREVNVARCRAEGVGLVRRVSGGGAIYLDEGQVGWEIVAARARLGGGSLDAVAARICGAVAAGLEQAFGVAARFRPRNDIEVGGLKLCGTGGFFFGDTLVYQGTVLVDMDAGRVRDLLNVPAAKLARHGAADGGARLTTLKALLGAAPPVAAVEAAVLAGLADGLGLAAAPGAATAEEEALAARLHDEEIGTDAFVFSIDDPGGGEVLSGEVSGPGGTVAAHLRLDRGRIREVLFAGDFFVAPPRAVPDLEAHLRDMPVEDAPGAAERFMAGIATLSLPPGAFAAALRAALEGAP